MKISGVDFPEPLLTALRNRRLVIFAGAGVSMGPPAGLPSFHQLADRVAEGTGETISTWEAEDRFLGRLKNRGVNVHDRAAELLRLNDPQPTALHHNLLRVYTNPEDVRIVTTNFDVLFQQASGNSFDVNPRLFQAPALPLGTRFDGIVQIHGSLDTPNEMVLTDHDFGRAYLTESDGWARRFLVDLFATYTVLFVGYSHNDTIMTYLTPSLPPVEEQRRFALIGDKSDDPDRWSRMGIQSITFPQTDSNDFSGLDTAVSGLARHLRSGILDWQSEITGIASGPPPVDEESTAIIHYALNDPVYARFFVEAADSPEWIEWLQRHGQLDGLFGNGDLSHAQRMLGHWLATKFATSQSEALLAPIQRQAERLHPHFWDQIAWTVAQEAKASLHPEAHERWVRFLTSFVPSDAETSTLYGVAEVCTTLSLWANLLQAYYAIANHHYQLPVRWDHNEYQVNHHLMDRLWRESLHPNLPVIAQSLLERTVQLLEERHSTLRAWGRGGDWGDQDSTGRLAIETHQQDRFPDDLDFLIDVARECSEWLVANDPDMAKLWSERLARSEAPLLQRLAIHVVSERTDLKADGTINWLITHCDIHDTRARHEMFKAVRIAYPDADQARRTAVITAVMAYQWPRANDPNGGRYAAHHHYDWLQWLARADPDCALVQRELEQITARYPEFSPEEHPDLPYWTGDVVEVVGKPTQWTVQDLFGQAPAAWLPQALEQNPQEYTAHPRDQIIDRVAEATKQNTVWGLQLAEALIQSEEWSSHLWRGAIGGWCSGDLEEDNLAAVIQILSRTELYGTHAEEIVEALTYLIDRHEPAWNLELLALANTAAKRLWQHIPNRNLAGDADWLSKALHHPAGQIAHCWVRSISIWRNHQEPQPERVENRYREALSEMTADEGLRGTLAKATLMSEFSFLAWADEEWVRENLIPVLTQGHTDQVAAWDGLIHCGRMHPTTMALLRSPFLDAMQHLLDEMADPLRRIFITKYAQMLVFSAESADDELIIHLFRHANDEDKQTFAMEVSRILRSTGEDRHRYWWDTWLNQYWQNRLQGVPLPLTDNENVLMTEWPMLLHGLFPEAVELAVRTPPVPDRGWAALRNINDSGLLERYPCSLARLLVHIGQTDDQPWIGFGIKNTVKRLLKTELPAELKRELRELVVRHNVR